MAPRALSEKGKEAVEEAFTVSFGYVHYKYGLDRAVSVLEDTLPGIRRRGGDRLGKLTLGDCHRLLAEMVDGNIEISWED